MKDPDKKKMSPARKFAVAVAVIVAVIGLVIVGTAVLFALSMNSWANSK